MYRTLALISLGLTAFMCIIFALVMFNVLPFFIGDPSAFSFYLYASIGAAFFSILLAILARSEGQIVSRKVTGIVLLSIFFPLSCIYLVAELMGSGLFCGGKCAFQLSTQNVAAWIILSALFLGGVYKLLRQT